MCLAQKCETILKGSNQIKIIISVNLKGALYTPHKYSNSYKKNPPTHSFPHAHDTQTPPPHTHTYPYHPPKISKACIQPNHLATFLNYTSQLSTNILLLYFSPSQSYYTDGSFTPPIRRRPCQHHKSHSMQRTFANSHSRVTTWLPVPKHPPSKS